MISKLTLAATALALAFISAPPSFADDEHNVSTGITAAGAPLGVHGVDPVALSTLNAVAEGNAAHTVVSDGVAYYFASADSARRFEAEPAKYKPQFGGFCAFAVALGKKFDGDPHYADVVDGKLYLFVNAAIFEKYKQDREGTIQKANATWPTIKHKAVGDL